MRVTPVLRRPAWRAASAAGHAVGRLTATRRRAPDFLVVGTQRGGTTSLYHALRQHPGFLRPWLRKGVHYFDVAYQQPMTWYLAHFPTHRQVAARAAACGHPVITGEFSPYYMWHPAAPARIAADLPEVKLVAMLRDPVERAYSAYAHELARGFETAPFPEAVQREPERLAGEAERMLADPAYASHTVRHHAYLARGRYIEQLERLASLVGRERLHLIDSADFFTHPEPIFAELCEFLGLPPITDGIRFEQHNARPRSHLPEPLRAQLRDYFAPYDARLAAWWGRTPSWRVEG